MRFALRLEGGLCVWKRSGLGPASGEQLIRYANVGSYQDLSFDLVVRERLYVFYTKSERERDQWTSKLGDLFAAAQRQKEEAEAAAAETETPQQQQQPPPRLETYGRESSSRNDRRSSSMGDV